MVRDDGLFCLHGWYEALLEDLATEASESNNNIFDHSLAKLCP